MFPESYEYRKQLLLAKGYTLVGAYHHEDKEKPYATLYKWKKPNHQGYIIVEVSYFQWARNEVLSVYEEISI